MSETARDATPSWRADRGDEAAWLLAITTHAHSLAANSQRKDRRLSK